METSTVTLTAWSCGLVGASYLAFALRLHVLGYVSRPLDPPRIAFFCAIFFSSMWGWLILAFLSTGLPNLLLLGELSDLLRYGGWFAFLLMILRTTQSGRLPADMGWMVPISIALLLFGLLARTLAALEMGWLGDTARLVLTFESSKYIFLVSIFDDGIIQ